MSFASESVRLTTLDTSRLPSVSTFRLPLVTFRFRLSGSVPVLCTVRLPTPRVVTVRPWTAVASVRSESDVATVRFPPLILVPTAWIKPFED